MKIWLMANTGGKIAIYLALVFLMSSCDKSFHLLMDEQKHIKINTECGQITINTSRFASTVFFVQKFDGAFWVHPDSFQLKFLPDYVRAKDLIVSLDGVERKSGDSFQVTNNYVNLNIKVFSPIPVSLDTVTMLVLPSDYIVCNNKRLMKDTIKVSLKVKR